MRLSPKPDLQAFAYYHSKIKVPFYCLLAIALSTGVTQAAHPPELILYTYDSMLAEGGLGPEIFKNFEKQCGCHLKTVALGDGGQLVTRLRLDQARAKAYADLVVGIDEPTFVQAQDLLELGGAQAILQGRKLRIDGLKLPAGFVPYDYGYFSWIADTQALATLKMSVPHRLSDLAEPRWKRQFILEDPRTSTPGLSFLLWSWDAMGSGAARFWQSLSSQWLTLAPGWDAAYSLFLKGEAPLVWSYTTSQAYHEEHGDLQKRYQAVLLEEGAPRQIEGAALVKNPAATEVSRRQARAFLQFLLSPEVQKQVALKNWMYPVSAEVALPRSFEKLPVPKAGKITGSPADPVKIKRTLSQWNELVSRMH